MHFEFGTVRIELLIYTSLKLLSFEFVSQIVSYLVS